MSSIDNKINTVIPRRGGLKNTLYGLLAGASVYFSSCSKDDSAGNSDGESSVVRATYNFDLDGDGKDDSVEILPGDEAVRIFVSKIGYETIHIHQEGVKIEEVTAQAYMSKWRFAGVQIKYKNGDCLNIFVMNSERYHTEPCDPDSSENLNEQA